MSWNRVKYRENVIITYIYALQAFSIIKLLIYSYFYGFYVRKAVKDNKNIRMSRKVHYNK